MCLRLVLVDGKRICDILMLNARICRQVGSVKHTVSENFQRTWLDRDGEVNESLQVPRPKERQAKSRNEIEEYPNKEICSVHEGSLCPAWNTHIVVADGSCDMVALSQRLLECVREEARRHPEEGQVVARMEGCGLPPTAPLGSWGH